MERNNNYGPHSRTSLNDGYGISDSKSSNYFEKSAFFPRWCWSTIYSKCLFSKKISVNIIKSFIWDPLPPMSIVWNSRQSSALNHPNSFGRVGERLRDQTRFYSTEEVCKHSTIYRWVTSSRTKSTMDDLLRFANKAFEKDWK